MTEPDLMKLRQEIDRLDAILTDTLEKRMDVVQQVAAYKDTRNMQVLDREREEQVIAKVVGMLKNPAYAPHMKQIMEKIMETSRNLQIDILAANIKKKEQNVDPIRVGYQGVKGSFSHQALEDYFADIAKVEMNFVHFEDVVVAVKNHEIKYGVLPIENSSTGGITEVYDLVRKYDCHIVGEKIIKVDQNLLGLPGAKIDELKQVYSHPQGLEQSRRPSYTDWKSWRRISITIQPTIPGSSSSPTSRNTGRTRTRSLWSLPHSMNRAPCTKCCNISIRAA